MTNRFMMSVAAAALIAGTGFASAQGTGGREAPSAGPAAQQSAPSADRAAPSSATPMNRGDADKAAPAAKTTQSDEKMPPGAAKSQRAQDDIKGGNMKGEKSKSMSSENDNAKGGSKEMKAEGRDDRNGMKAEGRTGSDTRGPADKSMNAETKGADSRATTTTGQAGAGAKLSTEQRTKISTVIRSEHVQPVTNVNFAISIGTRVPREVGFHPLPTEIVSVYPEWRGYEYILVRDQILVINPRTLEIVDVIDV